MAYDLKKVMLSTKFAIKFDLEFSEETSNEKIVILNKLLNLVPHFFTKTLFLKLVSVYYVFENIYIYI